MIWRAECEGATAIVVGKVPLPDSHHPLQPSILPVTFALVTSAYVGIFAEAGLSHPRTDDGALYRWSIGA